MVTRYEKLAEEISLQIRTGVLQPGDRIPSVRQFSRARGLSSNTVLQAYHLLEDRGEIRARPRSGYFVMRRASPDATVEAAGPLSSEASSAEDLAYELFEMSPLRDYVHLGIAWPSSRLYPVGKLARALSVSARRLGAQSGGPYFPHDNHDLRRHIAGRALEWGFDGDADEVVMTAGALEALNLCLRTVTCPGDFVAIESATLYAVRDAIARCGLRAIEIPTHPRDGVSLSALSAALKKHPRIRACLFMPTFQHPLGTTMPEEKKRELVRLLASRQIPLIENDVCGELYFGESRPRPAKAFDRQGLVLYCSSFSKSLAPGYAVGWTLPGKYRRAVQRAKWSANTMSGIPHQAAILDFIRRGGHEHHLRQLRRTLAALQKRAAHTVAAAFPSGTKLSRPAGGYIHWVQLPRKVKALELYRLALGKRITIAPAPIFSTLAVYENCFRLNYAREWTPRVEQALTTLGQMAASLT